MFKGPLDEVILCAVCIIGAFGLSLVYPDNEKIAALSVLSINTAAGIFRGSPKNASKPPISTVSGSSEVEM